MPQDQPEHDQDPDRNRSHRSPHTLSRHPRGWALGTTRSSPPPKGKRGRVAKSDAHNLHERLVTYETAVLRFITDPDVRFTNNRGEHKSRMAKVKQKVSGCFCTHHFTQASCRISSNLRSMAAIGYNPLVALPIALKGNAADMVKDTAKK